MLLICIDTLYFRLSRYVSKVLKYLPLNTRSLSNHAPYVSSKVRSGKTEKRKMKAKKKIVASHNMPCVLNS